MIRNLVAAWSIPDVRQRIVFVLGMFALFVVGLHIPTPGIDHAALRALIATSPFLNLVDVFSGSAFRRFTIFAMGITPYINASIIMQLMTVAVPSLEAKAKEGESGRREIARITRFATVALAMVQASGLVVMLSGGSTPVFHGDIFTRIQVVLSLTAGTMFLLWIGESITQHGIGQGVSLIIFVGIMARLPYDIGLTAEFVKGQGPIAIFQVTALLVIFLGTIVGIIYVTGGTRRIPVQHARRQLGQRTVQGQSSFLPFKINSAGVMPIIFAISLLMFPATVGQFLNNPKNPSMVWWYNRILDFTQPNRTWFAAVLYGLLIVGFTYSYSAIVFNIPELSENLNKNGSFVPGIRPGKATREYLDRVLSRITIAGAVFLAIIGLIQYWIPQITGITTFSLVGGTSLLIVVGVALDTMQNLEAHLVMRNYEGFIRPRSVRRRGGGGESLSLR